MLNLSASLPPALVPVLPTMARIADLSQLLGLPRLLGNRKSPGESSHRSILRGGGSGQLRWLLGLGLPMTEAGHFQHVQSWGE